MKKALSIILVIIGTSASAIAAPSVTEILSLNKAATGGESWSGKITLKAEYAYSGQGLTGATSSTTDLQDGRWVDTYALGPANGANGFDGTRTWAKEPSGSAAYQEGADALPLAVNESYRRTNLWWKSGFGGAAIVSDGEKTDAGHAYDVLTVTPRGGKTFDAWFDAKSHLLARVNERNGNVLYTTTFSAFGKHDSVMLPGKILASSGDHKYDQNQTLTSAAFLPKQPDAAYALPKVTLADFTIVGGAKETTFPFQLLNNHIYATVKVNGKGPYTFIFDTGGLNLVTPKLAKELGLNIQGKLEGRGAGEGTMEGGFTKVAALELGGARLKDQLFMSLPLDSLSNIEGVDEVGMVGFETFRRFVTRIDYGKQTITLVEPKSFDAKEAGTPVKIVFNGNTPEVDGSFDGIPGKFQIDTGSRGSLTLSKSFAETNKLLAKYAKGVDAVDGWGVGGPTHSHVSRGGVLRIGNVQVDHPVTSMSLDKKGAFGENNPLAGNIGAGLLKQFAVTFDYEHNTMYLKRVPGEVPDYGTFDRAGIWFNKDREGFKIVDVTANSPAAKVGLRPGDIITLVDGVPATSIALYDLRKRLRNDPPGMAVTLGVKRGELTRAVPVILQDLI